VQARVVPGALRVYLTLVDSPDLLSVNFPPDPPLKGEDGFDFSAWGALSRTRWSCFLKDHDVTLLTPPLEALRIDWSDPAAPVPLKGSSFVDAKVVKSGTVHAVVAWYSLEMGGDAPEISTAPDAPAMKGRHWRQSVFIPPHPLNPDP